MLLSSRKTLEICIVCSLNKIKKSFFNCIKNSTRKVNEVKTMFRHSNMAVQNISVTQFFHPDSSVSSRDTCSRHVHCLMILSPATLARVLAEGCGRSSWVRGSAFQVTGKFAKRVTTSWLVNIFFVPNCLHAETFTRRRKLFPQMKFDQNCTVDERTLRL